jgi:hypothetical protein
MPEPGGLLQEALGFPSLIPAITLQTGNSSRTLIQ